MSSIMKRLRPSSTKSSKSKNSADFSLSDAYFDEIGFKFGDNSCLGSTESQQELDGEEVLFYNDVSMYESDESLDMYTSKYTSQMTPGGGGGGGTTLRKTPGRPFDESPFRMQISQDVARQMDAANASRTRSIPSVDESDDYIDDNDDDAPLQERKGSGRGKIFKKQYSDPFHAFFAQLLKADEDSLTFSPSSHKQNLKLQIQDGAVDDYDQDGVIGDYDDEFYGDGDSDVAITPMGAESFWANATPPHSTTKKESNRDFEDLQLSKTQSTLEGEDIFEEEMSIDSQEDPNYGNQKKKSKSMIKYEKEIRKWAMIKILVCLGSFLMVLAGLIMIIALHRVDRYKSVPRSPENDVKEDSLIPLSDGWAIRDHSSSDPTNAPTLNVDDYSEKHKELLAIIAAVSPDSTEVIKKKKNSAQYLAFDWLANDENFDEYSISRLTQRWVLAIIFLSTGGKKSWSSHGSKWMSDANECSWFSTHSSYNCDEDGRISVISLAETGVTGKIPSEIGLLTGLGKIKDKGRMISLFPLGICKNMLLTLSSSLQCVLRFHQTSLQVHSLCSSET